MDGRELAGESWVGATVLDNVTADMDIAIEEAFGPVLAVIAVATLDEAIAVVNQSRFGNSTSIFTG